MKEVLEVYAVGRNHRVVSIDELHFDVRGLIQPVITTKAGVKADSLRTIHAN